MRSISRRNLFRLGAGTGLLLPMWKTMVPEVLGQESTRKRILFYAGAVSASEGHFPQSNGGSIRLTEGFSALEPYRNEMMFMRGLDAPWQKQLHGPDWFLTGRDGTPGGITLDRYIAKEIGRQDPVSSIQLAMIGCASSVNSVSADGRGQVFPAEHDPVRAYRNIFGSGLMPTGNNGDSEASRLLAERRSLLDFIRGDVNAMQAKLAGPEREKLDQYLTSLRDMENELSNLVAAQGGQVGAACSNVDAPNAFGRPNQSANTGFIDAQIDVAVNALICGMTSVAVLHKNCSATYPGGVGTHTMWHGSNNSQKTTYYKYHAGNMAKIRRRLGEVSESGGSVADQSLIVYFERCGIHHHNGQGDSFMMTIGSMGGYFNTGRYMSYRGQGRRVNDGFISIANAMGVNTNTFGDPNLSRGPLPGLRA